MASTYTMNITHADNHIIIGISLFFFLYHYSYKSEVDPRRHRALNITLQCQVEVHQHGAALVMLSAYKNYCQACINRNMCCNIAAANTCMCQHSEIFLKRQCKETQFRLAIIEKVGERLVAESWHATQLSQRPKITELRRRSCQSRLSVTRFYEIMNLIDM